MIEKENIIYEAKLNGYYYYYDRDGFISAFNTNTSEAQCFYRTKEDCVSRKDFETKLIYISTTIDSFESNG
jgi:hypothetical protein